MIQSHIPMSSPDLTAAEIEAVNRVLQTPYLSIGLRPTVQGCKGAGEISFLSSLVPLLRSRRL